MKTYGMLELTEASPPQSFVEPLDARQVRTWLALSETDPDEDQQDMIESLISAARSVAELYQHRDLAVKQWDLRLDEFPEGDVQLSEPLQSLDVFQYTDSTGTVTALAEGTDYSVDLSRSLVTPISGGSWPSASLQPSGGILIRFSSGYPPNHPFWANDGARLIQGMRMLIAGWHEGRLPYTDSTNSEYPFAVTSLFQMNVRYQVP